MKDIVKKELEKFISENPNADTFEIAMHFVEVSGRLYQKANENLPRYCGD